MAPQCARSPARGEGACTTVEIAEDLLRQAKAVAAKERTIGQRFGAR